MKNILYEVFGFEVLYTLGQSCLGDDDKCKNMIIRAKGILSISVLSGDVTLRRNATALARHIASRGVNSEIVRVDPTRHFKSFTLYFECPLL